MDPWKLVADPQTTELHQHDNKANRKWQMRATKQNGDTTYKVTASNCNFYS